MLKVELHTHTDHDPLDRIPHTSRELIDLAVAMGYHALAISLHDRFYESAADTAYARERGLVLLPGIERSIGGRHVLLINFPRECETVRTFADIAALKAKRGGLVVAPHPYYPTTSSLRGLLDAHADLFDAVERNAMYTPTVDFNRRAEEWARAH